MRWVARSFGSASEYLRRKVPGVALAARAVSFAAAAAVAIACHSSTSPSASDLSGTWTGTGSYPNAPFELKLVQTGSSLRGSYSDRHDSSNSVDGTLAGDVMTASIDFGDAKLHFEGTVEDARRVRGTMRTSALGNTPYPFTMTR